MFHSLNTKKISPKISHKCQPKIFKTWKFENISFKKPGEFSLNREILKHWKKFRHQANYLQHHSVSSLIDVRSGTSDVWYLILVYLLLYLKNIMFNRDWGSWRLYILWRLVLSIYKHASSITPRLVKTAGFDVPEHHFFPSENLHFLFLMVLTVCEPFHPLFSDALYWKDVSSTLLLTVCPCNIVVVTLRVHFVVILKLYCWINRNC